MENLSTWISVVSAVGTLFVAAIAAVYTAREHRNAREGFMQSMRSQWNELSDAWSRILLAQHGPDFHYVDATPEQRQVAKRVYEDLSDELGLEPGYSAALGLRKDVRSVVRFFNYAADAILCGRWRVEEAYEVFGPDVARHYKTVRLIAHRDNERLWFMQATEFNTFDEQDSVFLLAYLLRIEQCRRGDTYAHFMVNLANEMRQSVRAELKQSIRRVKRTRHRLWLPLAVQALLYRGRHPRVAAAYMVPEEPTISGVERELFRRPLETRWLTRARIWLAYNRTGAGSVQDTRSLALRALQRLRHGPQDIM